MSDVKELMQEYGCISFKDAKQNGISKFKFYKCVKDNQLEKVCHGFYSSKTELVDELYVLHQRCPNAVFSHDEAFYFYGLIDREPLLHTLTIYSGYNAHRLIAKGIVKYI